VPRLRKLAVEDWEEVQTAELDRAVEGLAHLDLVGFAADGTLVGVGQNMAQNQSAAVHWFDPVTLELVHSIENALAGSPKSNRVHPDGTLLAAGGSDGTVRVWELAERRLVHEFSVGDSEVQGVAFVGERHLAVATNRDGIDVYTLDPDELAELVRGSLTRDLTPTECDRYGLEDACVTLAVAGR
jgi:WD40 repeat protein